ncbi:hypothetical protein [Micromonospora ureilytica]|uniref:HNH endonuclease n=1 Tax=Micromonospora ureilytica TaxID=709868 RepID=A0ABS0JLF1_9ACTN|nr:hypothetical protein [Micromonospora ureilytica]MBG6067859.1 hypothetical protein [Micromonospora ureilytica]
MNNRDRRRAAEFAALMAARDARAAHPRNVRHAARNREEWQRHRAHVSLWPVPGCLVCEEAARDHDPFAN